MPALTQFELRLRSEGPFPGDRVALVFKLVGVSSPPILLPDRATSVGIYHFILSDPPEDFIGELKRRLTEVGAMVVNTTTNPVVLGSLKPLPSSAEFRISRLDETTQAPACCADECANRAASRFTFTGFPERYRSGPYCSQHELKTLQRLEVEGTEHLECVRRKQVAPSADHAAPLNSGR